MKSCTFAFGFLTFSILAGCTNSYQSTSGADANAATSTSHQPLLVANKALSSDVTSYANPIEGGLLGKLILQPRASMLAQDTETVGCGQAGQGALGLDAYISNATAWSSQDVLLTELMVPTRFFRLGFPSVAIDGSVVPVQSYFAINATGFFRLDPTDADGDYQFALIADDSARLKMQVNGAMTTVIDDEKPAGPNNGCLEQTQSAHMSCTSSWGDQSAAKIVTIHLDHGSLIPMNFQYWQGPGLGISMMGFYRKVAPGNSLVDSSCGQELGYGDGSDALNNVTKTWKPIKILNLTNSSLL